MANTEYILEARVQLDDIKSLVAGRIIGKSSVLKLWKEFDNMKPVKIGWHQLPGRKLKATYVILPRGREYGLNEDDMIPIDEWLNENIPSARRLSFDTWLFKQDKHITMFLLRWS